MILSAANMSTVSLAEVRELATLTEVNEPFRCLNCDRSEVVVPLISLRYDSDQAWICSQCLPTLIHRPGQLAGRLAKADTLKPAPPDDH